MVEVTANNIVVHLSQGESLDEASCLNLCGFKGYICTPKGAFENGDTQRIGWMFLNPTESKGKTRVEVYGARLKCFRDGKEIVLAEPEKWTGRGKICITSGEPHFTYRADEPGSRGSNEDDFRVFPNETWPGRFSHRENSGNVIEGSVQLIPLAQKALPKVFRGMDFKISQVLPQNVIGNWGMRIFRVLDPQEVGADPGDTDVLIDVVRQKALPANLSNILSVSAKLRAEFPSAVLFRMPLDGKVARVI